MTPAGIRPDDAALADVALELVLPEAAELGEIPGELLAPKILPDLWSGERISAQAVLDYFNGFPSSLARTAPVRFP